MPLLDSLAVAGIVNAILLALASAIAARRDRRWAWLCALFFVIVVSFTAILITHRTEGRAEQIAVVFEQISWAAGPVLYHYVRMSLGYPVTLRRAWIHFLLPAAILLIGTPLILIGGFEPLPPEWLIAQQAAYTAASILLFVHRPQRADRSPFGYWWPGCILGAMVGIHIAQFVRMSPLGARVEDIVPIIGALGMMTLVVVALAVAQQVPKKSAAYAKSSIGAARARSIFEEARAALEQDEYYKRFDLSLGDVAARIDVGVHHLSQSLSTAGETSFGDLVARMRVAEAKRLLLDPANRGVAVEPLGMEAGFRSRSAFYAAFRDETGLSPAEYRKSFMSSPSGQDMAGRD